MTSAELYRDPVYDGATDPVVVIADGVWWMFYTQRRATHPDPGPGVAWVHGSRIGVAQSPDGIEWAYIGTLEPDAAGLALREGPPPAVVDATHWAPEVIHDGAAVADVPDRDRRHSRSLARLRAHDRRVRRRTTCAAGSVVGRSRSGAIA